MMLLNDIRNVCNPGYLKKVLKPQEGFVLDWAGSG